MGCSLDFALESTFGAGVSAGASLPVWDSKILGVVIGFSVCFVIPLWDSKIWVLESVFCKSRG